MFASTMTHRNIFIVMMLIATITACSFKTIYNKLDYLIPEYIEGMVTLDEVLEKRLEYRTQLLVSWHRNTQLNQYADWLRKIQRDVDTQFSQAQLKQSQPSRDTINQRINEIDQFWKTLANKINQEVAQLLPELNPQQQQELFSQIEDNNSEFHEEYIDLNNQERIDTYNRRLIDSYENWLGDLTTFQEAYAHNAAEQLVTTADLRLKRRIEWQQGIRKILTETQVKHLQAEQLQNYLNAFEQPDNDTLKQKSAINRGILAQLTAQIIHSMTTEQKDHFMDKTNDYIRMFTELAQQNPG